MKNTKFQPILCLPIAMALSTVFGVAIGVANNNIPMGICVGVGVGGISGGLFTIILTLYKKDK